MSLNVKITITIASIMALSMLAYYGVFQAVILKSYVDLDNRLAEKNMSRCVAAFDREIELLDRFVHDWASWDDLYAFARDGNQDFIKKNLEGELSRDQDLNLIAIFNEKGGLVWKKNIDLMTGREISFDPSRDLRSAIYRALINQRVPRWFTRGVIQTPNGPMIVSSRPILDSKQEGPSHGALIMGRFLARDSMEALSKQVDIKLNAWPLQEGRTPESIRHVLASLGGRDSIGIFYASLKEHHVYKIIRDISGDPVILLEASIPGETMEEGTSTYNMGMLFILGIGIITLLSISFMMGAFVLKPVAQLKENVLAVGGSQRDAPMFDTGRKDEIGILSREFGFMLQRLSDNEMHYRTIFENTGTAMVIIGEDMTILIANSNFETLSGYSRKDLEGKMSMVGFIADDDVEKMRQYHELRGKDPHAAPKTYEIHFKNFLGDLKDILVSVAMIPGTKERVLACMDITERKRAIEALRQSEERYRGILEDMEESYYEVDLDGRFTFFSPSLVRNFGYSESELMVISYRDYMKTDDAQRVFETFNHVYFTGEAIKVVDWKVLHKDGREISLEASVSLCRGHHGKAIGFKGVTRDVTQKKKTEEALQRSEEIFSKAFHTSPMSMIIISLDDRRLIEVNRAFEQLAGYSREEIIGRPISQMGLWKDPQVMEGPYQKLISDGGYRDFETIIRTKAGEMRSILLSAELIVFEDELCSLTVAEDITERKLAAEERERREKLHGVMEVAGTVCHEINQPLQIISGYTDLMLMVASEHDQQRAKLTVIKEQIQRINKISSKLMMIKDDYYKTIDYLGINRIIDISMLPDSSDK